MKPTGCIRCGAAGAHVLFPLELVGCDDCARAWGRDESLSLETVIAHLGFAGRVEDFTTQHGTAFDAELLARTLAWALAEVAA